MLHCIARRYKAADSGSARSEVQRWDRRTGLSANLAEDGGFTKAEAEAIVDTAGEVVFLDDRGRFGDDDEDGDDDDDDRAASTGDSPHPGRCRRRVVYLPAMHLGLVHGSYQALGYGGSPPANLYRVPEMVNRG